MKLLGVLPFARFLLERSLKRGDYALDCTIGNGHDTLFLAKLVGEEGKVFGFDIQEQGIKKTEERLANQPTIAPVTLFHTGHEHVATVLTKEELQRVQGVIFNLGYLPGGDKEIITQPSTTLNALETLLHFLPSGATIVLVIYHGHKGGKEEMKAILSFAERLDQRTAHVAQYKFMNQANDPPFIVAIEKR